MDTQGGKQGTGTCLQKPVTKFQTGGRSLHAITHVELGHYMT